MQISLWKQMLVLNLLKIYCDYVFVCMCAHERERERERAVFRGQRSFCPPWALRLKLRLPG